VSLKKSWINKSSTNALAESERIINRAVEQHAASGKHRWSTCFAARHIVGTYERGRTLELARKLAVSVSAVDKMAGAAVCYWVLRKWSGTGDGHNVRWLHQARDVLSFSHFYEVALLWKKYEFSPFDAMRFLVEAAEHRATVENLKDKINAAYSAGQDTNVNLTNEALSDPTRNTPAALLEQVLGDLTGTVTDVIPSGTGQVHVKVLMDSETAPSPGDTVKLVVIKQASDEIPGLVKIGS
jgi:hypothetical protein